MELQRAFGKNGMTTACSPKKIIAIRNIWTTLHPDISSATAVTAEFWNTTNAKANRNRAFTSAITNHTENPIPLAKVATRPKSRKKVLRKATSFSTRIRLTEPTVRSSKKSSRIISRAAKKYNGSTRTTMLFVKAISLPKKRTAPLKVRASPTELAPIRPRYSAPKLHLSVQGSQAERSTVAR